MGVTEMRRFLHASLATAALTFGASFAASAADIPAPVYKAPPMPVASWTGFYVGVNGGYAWGDRSVSYIPNDPAATFFFTGASQLANSTLNISGGFGGLQLGYNWQFNPSWLFGLETDFDFASIKGRGASSNTFFAGANAGTATVAENIKWFGTVRARLGYLITNNFLVYGTGGIAYGRVQQTANYVETPTSFSLFPAPGGFNVTCFSGLACFAGASSSVQTGWTAGAGVEWAIWKNLTLKTEYLYVNLGSHSFRMAGVVTPAPFTQSSATVNFGQEDFHTVRIGLNFRF